MLLLSPPPLVVDVENLGKVALVDQWSPSLLDRLGPDVTDHGMRTAANAIARGSNPRPIAPAL